MKGKSLLAALLSAMMIFGTAVPAFADNTETGNNQTQDYELYGTPDYEAPVLTGMSVDKTETEPYVVDTQAPKLNKILLSKTEVQAGETIIVNVEGTDDISGIDDWDAYFESDSGETLATTTVSDGITKTIEIEVSEYKPSGVYHLVSASVWDKAGNSRDYFANPTGNQEKLPHNLSITVINDDVSTPNTDSGNHTGNGSSNHSGVVNYESEKPNQNDKKAVEAYNFWQNVKNKIHKAEKGKTVKLFVPKEITNMPASVMEMLRRENVGLTIKQNGKTITIPAGKAQPKQKLKAYWTFKTLDRLY